MSENIEMEVQRSLGRVEAGIAALNARLDGFIATHSVDSSDLFKRVGKLERWRAYTLGYIAASVAIMATLFAVVWRIIPLITR